MQQLQAGVFLCSTWCHRSVPWHGDSAWMSAFAWISTVRC